VNWSDLFAFMTARDPELADHVVGAAPEDVATTQRELGITFPAVYVDFLLTMGVETGRFHPFGRGVDSNFYRVLEQIPPEDYDIHDYFLIGRETDTSRCPMVDLYLDLRRSGVEDGAVVDVEQGSEWEPEQTNDLTLLERLTRLAWRSFEAARFAHDRVIFVPVEAMGELPAVRQRVLSVLSRRGHEPTLPPLPRLDCLGSETAASFLHTTSKFKLVDVILAEDDEQRLRQLVEIVLDNVPGASIDERRPSLISS